MKPLLLLFHWGNLWMGLGDAGMPEFRDWENVSRVSGQASSCF